MRYNIASVRMCVCVCVCVILLCKTLNKFDCVHLGSLFKCIIFYFTNITFKKCTYVYSLKSNASITLHYVYACN